MGRPLPVGSDRICVPRLDLQGMLLCVYRFQAVNLKLQLSPPSTDEYFLESYRILSDRAHSRKSIMYTSIVYNCQNNGYILIHCENLSKTKADELFDRNDR